MTARRVAAPLRWLANIAVIVIAAVAARGAWDMFNGMPFLGMDVLWRIAGLAVVALAAGTIADRLTPDPEDGPLAPPHCDNCAAWIRRWDRLWYISVSLAAFAGLLVVLGVTLALVGVVIHTVCAVVAAIGADLRRNPDALPAEAQSS